MNIWTILVVLLHFAFMAKCKKVVVPLKRRFTVESVDSRYGFLRRYADKTDLVEFSPDRLPSYFMVTSFHQIVEMTSWGCIHPRDDQQIVLGPCARKAAGGEWSIKHISASPNLYYLIYNPTKKCLSPWNYNNVPPQDVNWVPGLDDCGEYNKVILKWKSKCEMDREIALAQAADGRVGGFVPVCAEDGSYKPIQCSGSTGYCWCVYEDGQTIPGTEVPPGDGIPICPTPRAD